MTEALAKVLSAKIIEASKILDITKLYEVKFGVKFTFCKCLYCLV